MIAREMVVRGYLLVALALVLAACGGGDKRAAVTIELAEANDSGQTGTATLADAGASGTTVVVTVTPPERYPGDVQVVSVNEAPCTKVLSAGSLEDQEATVKQVLTEIRDGRSETTATNFATLTGGGHSINVYQQNPPYKPVVCGDIPER